ncbi:MAG: IspD/TarI family cytidylyltransferase [Ancrocorticia sp.]|uniref:IspD/TarI family cytidylyltransferase n=1 Tax=Ancrocorticia sp. TaxID=2593684 RepID=UPI003F8DF07F
MNIAVLFAGGVGSRMKAGTVPKQFLEIHGKPVIVHTLELFEHHPEIDAIAVAILPSARAELEKLIRRFDIEKVRWVVDGGATGQESRHNALKAVAADCPEDSVVLVHDGVRPLINDEIISQNIDLVKREGNAITCSKVTETIVESHEHILTDVIPRDHLYAAQAPQSFKLGEILDLYDRAVSEGENDSIDSCSLMHRYGKVIHRITGPKSNIKITTADDLYIARTYFSIIENQQLYGMPGGE